MNILIVEDHPVVVKTLHGILNDIYPTAEIKSFNSIEEAEKIIKHHFFDLIITDLDFNGEKRYAIVELAKNYGIKCMIYTGHYNMSFIRKALELNAIAFISKLGDLDDLQFALKNFKTIENYICSYCIERNKTGLNIEILNPDLKSSEALILDQLLAQIPRKEIAKKFKLTPDTLNTYINRMTAKNNCTLLVLIHRYIIWKRSIN